MAYLSRPTEHWPVGQDSAPFCYSNLLEELLLALVGYYGDVFVEPLVEDHNKDIFPAPESCRLHLSTDVDWVDDPVRDDLNDIVKLGYHYKAIALFVHCQQYPSGNTKPSIYRRAMASGLTEILDVYRAAVLQLQVALQEQQPVLAHVKSYLTDFLTLLPQLHQLCHQVQKASPGAYLHSGAELINLLHDRMRFHASIPLQSVIERLLWHCNQILLKQITSWMVHGMLEDPNGEFFICVTKQPEAGSSSDGRQASTSGRSADDATYKEWHGGFEIRYTHLPPYVSKEQAEAILFVGKAVRLLKRPAGAFQGQQLLPFQDTLEYGQAILRLQQEPVFDRHGFSETVEAIRTKVAALLWHLVVVRADLKLHLAAIKDYFLLAKGDFWQSFLEESGPVMGAPPRPLTAVADISVAFHQSALKSTATHDILFPHFKLTLDTEPIKAPQGPVSHGPAHEVPGFEDSWSGLQLVYGVEWPLGLIITPQQLNKYNALFALLLRIKRLQFKLEDAWKELGIMTGRGKVDARLFKVQLLRNHMAHVITNLQIYIQTDVFEVKFAELEAKIQAAHDFKEVEDAHHLYLAALHSQVFLTSVKLCEQIGKIFQKVKDLCDLITNAQHDPAALDPRALDAIKQDYRAAIGALMMSVSSQRMQEAACAPQLQQLATRLNYNESLSSLLQ